MFDYDDLMIREITDNYTIESLKIGFNHIYFDKLVLLAKRERERDMVEENESHEAFKTKIGKMQRGAGESQPTNGPPHDCHHFVPHRYTPPSVLSILSSLPLSLHCLVCLFHRWSY